MKKAEFQKNILKEAFIAREDPILVTGGTGFIGRRVVETLLELGFKNLRFFVRPSSNCDILREMLKRAGCDHSEAFVEGNLLDRDDCVRAARGVRLVYHLAAGTGEKAFAEAFRRSVLTTRNLLDACLAHGDLQRFVNISSFAVYSNRQKGHGRLLDETCPIEDQASRRGDAYCYAKVKQDELVMEYGKEHGVDYVLMRPGVVYGPGRSSVPGRVGMNTFGFFAHLGGGNRIPFTYVDNCADAIVLAGLKPGVGGEAFNIVDNDVPTSRQFLRAYKKRVKSFFSVPVPHAASYMFCWLWEKYSTWSEGQLPAVYNRMTWHAYWKRTTYSNEKIRRLLGWEPRVSTNDALSLIMQDGK